MHLINTHVSDIYTNTPEIPILHIHLIHIHFTNTPLTNTHIQTQKHTQIHFIHIHPTHTHTYIHTYIYTLTDTPEIHNIHLTRIHLIHIHFTYAQLTNTHIQTQKRTQIHAYSPTHTQHTHTTHTFTHTHSPTHTQHTHSPTHTHTTQNTRHHRYLCYFEFLLYLTLIHWLPNLAPDTICYGNNPISEMVSHSQPL